MVNSELFRLIHETTSIILQLDDKIKDRNRDNDFRDEVSQDEEQLLNDMFANLGSLRTRAYRIMRRIEKRDAKVDNEARMAPAAATKNVDMDWQREQLRKSVNGEPK